jgi:WXXGXW repeat (2 copies)
MIIAVLSLISSLTSAQTQVVRIRPVAQIAVRPVCPARGHVWVNDSWKWNHRTSTYAFVSGYWAKPHRRGSFWIDGHWRQSRAGWRYVPGHWA